MFIIIKHLEFRKKIVVDNKILNVGNEINTLIKEDRYDNGSFKDLKKASPDEFRKLEEALINYISENDLKILKTEFLD